MECWSISNVQTAFFKSYLNESNFDSIYFPANIEKCKTDFRHQTTDYGEGIYRSSDPASDDM